MSRPIRSCVIGRDGLLFSSCIATNRGDTLAVDLRPSDALALALRTKAPVLVAEHVLEAASTLETPRTQDQDRLQRWLESLDPEDLGKYKM
jgi:bifunctional DNase/RNase